MSITIAGVTFDRVVYDQDGDVLYLHVGEPSTAVDFDESPEGHGLRFDIQGRLVGLTLVRPRQLIERGESIVAGAGAHARAGRAHPGHLRARG